MPQTSKANAVTFAFRSRAAGAQDPQAACRAFRVIARPAEDFSAAAPAVVAGALPGAPVGAQDGAYPVWVRLTDWESGMPLPSLLLVDGDGWNLAPTGRGWTIEYAGGAGTATDRLCYVVETVQDVNETGQVNSGRPLLARDLRVSAVAQAAGWTNVFRNPGWATRLAIHLRSPNAAIVLAFTVRVADADGVYRVQAGSFDATGVQQAGGSVGAFRSLIRMGYPDAVGQNLTDAGAVAKNAHPAPAALELVSTAAVDAGKQAVLEAVWAP